MVTCIETAFKIKLGDKAEVVARRRKDDVEVAIYDSENYGVFLTFDQWKRMIFYSKFIDNGSEELKKVLEEKNKRRVMFQFEQEVKKK
jgi:hypothetical protein